MYKRRKSREWATSTCRDCGKEWECTAAHSHPCDPHDKVARAIETRRFSLLKWAVEYLEEEMRRVMRAAGVRHRKWRKGQADPNEYALREDYTGERVREIGRQYWAVMRALWEPAKPAEVEEAA